MREAFSFGLLAAVGAGVSFGLINTLEGALARLVGAVNVSVAQNLAAGLLSLLILVYSLTRGKAGWVTTPGVIPIGVAAGVLIFLAVVGLGFAMPRLGVVAGTLGLISGQIATVVIIDTFGLLGYERIALNPARLGGLLLMAAGTYLVLPRA